MSSKAEKKRKRAGRPRKVEAKRYPSGKVVNRPVNDPNEDLKSRLEADGASCPIARAMKTPLDPSDPKSPMILTPDQARALEQYRADRHAAISLGDVMDKPGPLARIMIRDRSDHTALPSSWAEGMTDERRERAAERYRAAYAAIKATRDFSAAGQCALVCGGYTWTRPEALKRGAEALRALYAGDKRRKAA